MATVLMIGATKRDREWSYDIEVEGIATAIVRVAWEKNAHVARVVILPDDDAAPVWEGPAPIGSRKCLDLWSTTVRHALVEAFDDASVVAALRLARARG